MATNLIVRNVDADIVKALKERAAQNGVSAEAEHRALTACKTATRGVQFTPGLIVNHNKSQLEISRATTTGYADNHRK